MESAALKSAVNKKLIYESALKGADGRIVEAPPKALLSCKGPENGMRVYPEVAKSPLQGITGN